MGYRIGLVSSDNEIKSKLEEVEYFDTVSTFFNLAELEKSIALLDVVVLCEDLVTINDLNGHLSFSQKIKSVKNIFYKANEFKSGIEDILSLHDIKMVPMKLTNEQVVDYLVKIIVGKVYKTNNIVTFFGADAKVGTTMIAQSVAEQLSKDKKIRVLLVYLTGHPEDDYINIQDLAGFDELKNKLFNRILTITEVLDVCSKPEENLYVIKGIENFLDRRFYTPSVIDYFLKIVSKRFDAVIIDAGSNIELGMVVGALNATSNRILITTQEPTVVRRHTALIPQVYKRLGMTDFMLIVNKYIKDSDLMSEFKLADNLGANLIGTIPNLQFGLQCQEERKTLLSLGVAEFETEIISLVNIIVKRLSLDYTQTKLSIFGKIKKLLGVGKRG